MNAKDTLGFKKSAALLNSKMLAPQSVPSLELMRIAALRSLLPVRAEEDVALQDLLRVAAHALRCPMALFSLLDGERQWPKAGFGLTLDMAGMPMALCAGTLRGHDVQVVSDALLDPVMGSHPLVTGESGVRFYAGTALRLDGHRIGSLCVLDRMPRTLDSDSRALLLEVARSVEQWMRSCRDQAQLAQREHEFRQLAEEMPGVLYRMPLGRALGADPLPQYVSPQVRHFGYSPEQWTQSPGLWQAVIHPDDLLRVRNERLSGLATGEHFELSYRLRTSDGQWVPVRDVVHVVRSADGSAPVIHGVIMDQSHRVVLRDRHELIVRTLPDGLLVLDARGVIIEVNPRLQQILDLTPAQLLGRRMADLFAEEVLHRGNGGPAVRLSCVQPDGRTLFFEDSAGPLVDGLQVHVLRDVSQRHEEESWLRKLSQAADQASESIVITDLQGNIEYVNRAALSSSGYTREELIGCNSRILQSGLTPASRYRKLWGSLLAGQPWRGFLNNRRKDGSHYIEFAVISPVFGPDGTPTNYLAVKEDITEKRRMGEDLQRYRNHLDELVAQRTEELEKARRSAETASAAKSAFLATMSHEIRTPMNGVIGIADVLQRSDLTPHQRDLVDTMRESALALLTVIDDILDFSKIEAGRLVLEHAPMSLWQLVEKTADALQPVAAARGVRLHAFVDPDLPEHCVGDAARLRQIVINLVGNAIKFSAGLDRPGRVALRLLPGVDGQVRLEVADNGIGMSPDVIERLFQPFVQGEISTTRQYGGTGLGLVITQRLVGAMNGSVEVHSEPGRGSLFTVQLPLTGGGGDGSVRATGRFDLSGLDVWLALDDSEPAADWVRYLRAAGARAEIVSLTTVRTPPPGSVIVCEPHTLSRWPKEALATVHAVLVRHELRAAPRTVYPGLVELDCEGLHRDDLLQAVLMAAGRIAPAPAPAPAHLPKETRVEAGPGASWILVAEDNEINQKVIRQQLELLGLPSEHVGNGQEALSRWRSDRGRYGLLLTDLHMPVLDGFALTAAIREEEARTGEDSPRIPVIALTANVAGTDAERCRQAGMDDYLSKPVQIERLRDTLQQWLRRPVAAPAPRAAPSETIPEPVQSLAQPDFDDAVLQRLVGQDIEVLADLHQRYLKSLDTAVSEVAAQVQRSDWGAAGLTAHRLKSSSRAMGALRLGWIFDRMEIAGRHGDGAQVQELANDLVGAAQSAVSHYRQLAAQGRSQLTPAVLCVDDDASQLAWLEHQLRSLGIARPETYLDGDRLLERLAGVATDGMLLLLDLNMPRMDGVDLIRKLVRLRYAGVLVLLGSSDRRVIQAAERLARAQGLNTLGHLLKPLQEEALRATLARWPLMPVSAPAGGAGPAA